jgi:hypothetical protein
MLGHLTICRYGPYAWKRREAHAPDAIRKRVLPHPFKPAIGPDHGASEAIPAIFQRNSHCAAGCFRAFRINTWPPASAFLESAGKVL